MRVQSPRMGRCHRSTSWANACGSSSVRTRHIACSSVEEKSDGQEKSLLAISVICVVASFRFTEPAVRASREWNEPGACLVRKQFYSKGLVNQRKKQMV